MACRTHRSCVICSQLPTYWESLPARLGLVISKSIWLISTLRWSTCVHRGVNTGIGLTNFNEFGTHGVNTLSSVFSHLEVLSDVAEVGFPDLF